MRDYSINMQDSTGKQCVLYVNADTIRELQDTGMSVSEAVESVEGNAFANAIARGDIGADAWSV